MLTTTLLSAVLTSSPAGPTLEEIGALVPAMRPWKLSGWTVLSDAPRDSVQQVQRTLERTRQEWHRFLRLMERPRTDAPEELVCLLFAHGDDYESFAARHDDLTVDAESVPGYFSPRNGWIVFLDPGDHDDLDAAQARLDEAQRDIDAAASAGHGVREAQARLDEARRELASNERIRRMALTAHETVHQLVHGTEAFPHHTAWPDWLHEAISTSFETADRRRPFGPDRDFAHRREAFLQRLDEGSASTIETLLSLRKLDHDDPSQITAAYVDGCALVSWLARTRRSAMARFLDTIGTTDDTGRRLNATVAFKRTIGDPANLTRTWWADERRRN